MGKNRKDRDNERHWNSIVDLMRKYDVQPPQELAQAGAEMQYAFAEKVALFLAPLDKERSELALREGTRTLHESLDNLLGRMPTTVRFADEDAPVTLACKKGCNYCCTIRVTLVAPEVLTLAHYIRKKFSVEAMEGLLLRIDAHEAESLTMTPLQQVLRSTMCPLNVDMICSGYSARPIGCIGYHSFNLQRCIEDSLNPAGEAKVPQDPQRWMIRGMHTEALEAGMKAMKLDNSELEFVPALRIALLDLEACAKYLRGEPVFASANKQDIRQAQALDLSNRNLTMVKMTKLEQ